MIDPVVFHIAWFLVGVTMFGIPAFLLYRFGSLSNNHFTKKILEGTMFIGVVQIFSVFIGALVVGFAGMFNPFICVGLGNIGTLTLFAITD